MPSRRTLFALATSSAVGALLALTHPLQVVNAAAAFVGQTSLHSPRTRFTTISTTTTRKKQTSSAPFLVSVLGNHEQHQKRPGAASSTSGLSYRNTYDMAIATPSSSSSNTYWSPSNSTFMSSCTVTGDLDYNQYVNNYAVWERSTTRAVDTTKPQLQQYRVFCDLDGVLVDFAHGITQVLGLESVLSSHNIDALPRRDLWETVARAPCFFEHLPWCPGGRELWEALVPLRPHILTGVPSYCMTAPRDEKFNWCRRELVEQPQPHRVPVRFQHVDKAARWGPLRVHATVRRQSVVVRQQQHDDTLREADSDNVNNHRCNENDWTCQVITCWSEQKFRESGPGAVLIDDRIDLKPAWEAQGGIFIHHETGNVENTLRQLREHGILPSADDDDDEVSYKNLWRRPSFRP